MKRFLLGFVGVSFTITGYCGDIVSVFDIALGSPIAKYPICSDVNHNKKQPCATLNRDGRETFAINLGDDKSSPRYIQNNLIPVGTIGKNIESIRIPTKGVNFQNEILTALIDKFGKPDSLEMEKYSNAFGIEITAPVANWTIRNSGSDIVYIDFQAVVNSIDNGVIFIYTKKYLNELSKRNDIEKAKQHQL